MIMEVTSAKSTDIECPSIEIAAYLDGELSAEAEADLEDHISKCEICTQDLNDQKQFMLALNGSLNETRAVTRWLASPGGMTNFALLIESA